MIPKAAIFIDGGYFDYVLKEFGEPRIDFGRFSEGPAEGRAILRTYYYHCLPYKGDPPSDDESKRLRTRKSSSPNSIVFRLTRYDKGNWSIEGSTELPVDSSSNRNELTSSSASISFS